MRALSPGSGVHEDNRSTPLGLPSVLGQQRLKSSVEGSSVEGSGRLKGFKRQRRGYGR